MIKTRPRPGSTNTGETFYYSIPVSRKFLINRLTLSPLLIANHPNQPFYELPRRCSEISPIKTILAITRPNLSHLNYSYVPRVRPEPIPSVQGGPLDRVSMFPVTIQRNAITSRSRKSIIKTRKDYVQF